MRDPRIAEALLRGFISDPGLEDAILGDLAEEWNERAERPDAGPARARYWEQVLRSVPHLLRQWWLQQSPARAVRTLGRVALVLLLAIALIAVTTVGMLIVAGGAPGQPGPDVTRAMLLAGSAWAGVAGFVLACRTADVPMVPVVLLALSWIPATPLAAVIHPTPGPPDWYFVLFPAVLSALTVAGGAIATTLRGTGHLEGPPSRTPDPSTSEDTMKKETSLLRLAARPLLAAAVLLAVPLVAMQFTGEVDWTLFDFAFMGTLVFGTGLMFEWALTRTDSNTYRAAAGLALAAAFLLVWVNGAVGIIGAADNGANMMYFGVLAVGIGGAIGAGFEPGGMARAMVATAVVQLAVGAFALVAGLGSPAHVVGLTGMFVVLFLGSAWLFNEAAPRRGRQSDEGATSPSGNDVIAAGDQNGSVVMMTWLRPILRAFEMGLVWAAGWAIVGVGIGVTTGFLPDGHSMRSFLDPWLALAMPGFIGGVVFSVVLRIAEGHRSFVELSLPRAAAWGAVTGLLLGVVPFTPLGTPTDAFPLWLLGVGIIGTTTLLSTVSATGSLSLARIADDWRR